MSEIWQTSDVEWDEPAPPRTGGDLDLEPEPEGEPVPEVEPRTNVAAIASMALGILWLWWVGSIAAIVLGHLALNQIAERGEEGRGMAITGLVLGYLLLVALFVGVLL